MRLLCALGSHRVDPGTARWNGGHCFGKCRRCGRDLVRTGAGRWQVPHGYRVVWRALPSAPEPGPPEPQPIPAAAAAAAEPAALPAGAACEYSEPVLPWDLASPRPPEAAAAPEPPAADPHSEPQADDAPEEPACDPPGEPEADDPREEAIGDPPGESQADDAPDEPALAAEELPDQGCDADRDFMDDDADEWDWSDGAAFPRPDSALPALR
ncbi:MAG TPA: hypothetical protein VGW34_03195 [Allosphingosinicella sp.]|nr:hypothetical protein [Allosphingosinicella sp.]